tara:strand:- start:222 stop:446 length:225 start_codon:yes stop_codon:yes gene_type:complete
MDESIGKVLLDGITDVYEIAFGDGGVEKHSWNDLIEKLTEYAEKAYVYDEMMKWHEENGYSSRVYTRTVISEEE